MPPAISTRRLGRIFCKSLEPLWGSGWRIGTEYVDVRSPSSLTLRSSHPGLPPIIFARSQASADASGHLNSTVGKNFLQVSGTPLGGGHLHSTVGKNFLQVSGTPLGEPLWGARGHPQEPLQSVGHPLRHHQSRAHPQADYITQARANPSTSLD